MTEGCVGPSLPDLCVLFGIATCLAVLLAIIAYRSGRVAWYHVLTAPDLPDVYYIGGNWTSHCTLIQDPTSDDLAYCEDITFWDHHHQDALTHRLVLLGCDPNRKAWNTVMGPLHDPNPRGHLFLYDPASDEVRRLVLAGYPEDHDFHPLGMAVAPSREGSPSNLFVINHARARSTIEQFVLDPQKAGSAQYIRTLRSPYFVSPNSIALTSPTSFFVSNDHLFTLRLPYPIGSVLPVVETVAGLPLGWVAHVSAGELDSSEAQLEHRVAAPGIPFANGIALSPSGTQLAVAVCSLGLVYFYDVHGTGVGIDDSTTPTLSFSHSVAVPFFPDNLAYDDDGALIAAGHPHFPSLIRVAANETGATAPSYAVSIMPRENNTSKNSGDNDDRNDKRTSASKFVPAVSKDVETLFVSDGSVFGSSTTTRRDSRTGTIYVAGMYERGILACRP